MKILIADDNSKFRKVLVSFLDDLNAEIIEASNGDEAVKYYREYLPDFAILDIKMGKTDGLKASSIIMNEFPNAKIIIITGYNDLDIRTKAYETGVKYFIPKEDASSITEIINKLRKLP